MVKTITWLCLALCCISSVSSQSRTAHNKKTAPKPTTQDQQAEAAATQALATLEGVINATNYKQFGLDSPDQIKQLKLGVGVPLFYVRADQLKSYTPGSDAGKLMISSGRRLYPVLVDGVGKLLLTIEDTPTGWRLVSFGQQDIAPALSKLKAVDLKKKTTGPGSSPQDYFAVQIPSMHLNFLAYAPPPGPGGPPDAKRQVSLTPLNGGEQLKQSIGFKGTEYLALNPHFSAEGQAIKSANDVFTAIAPQAGAAMQTNAPR